MITDALLRKGQRNNNTLIATHGDADGIAAGVIRALQTPTTSSLYVLSGGKFDMELAQATNKYLRREKHKELDFLADNPGLFTSNTSWPKNIYIQDVALAKNKQGIQELLRINSTEKTTNIHFVDHHDEPRLEEQLEELTKNPHFSYNIDLSRNTSTADIVNKEYHQAHNDWAIVGLSGDRIIKQAETLAKQEHLKEQEYQSLVQAGEAINYNSFVHQQPPTQLLKEGFDTKNAHVFAQTKTIEDLIQARSDGLQDIHNNHKKPFSNNQLDIYVLEDNDQARGLFAEFAYAVAEKQPNKWHAVIVPKHPTEDTKNRYDISLRGPHSVQRLAHALSGGGRETAGGAASKHNPEQIIQELTTSDAYKHL